MLKALCGAIGALTLTATNAQTPPLASAEALSALTVPAALLPSGCALAPPPWDAPRPDVPSGVHVPQFTANPWVGTDPTTLAVIQIAIDPSPKPPPLPDALQPPPRAAAAAELARAAHIVRAYHAAYLGIDGLDVEVFAAMFDDVNRTSAPESAASLLNLLHGLATRFVRGAIVSRVSGPASAQCFLAVRSYLAARK